PAPPISGCMKLTVRGEWLEENWSSMNTDSQRSNTWLYLCSCVLICAAFLFFYRLSDRDLWSSHEGRAAQDAQSILDSGDWVLPRLFDNQPELQKPPLYYWLVAGIAWLRGGRVDTFAERLPAALAALGTVALVRFGLGAQGRPIAGGFAALVLDAPQHFGWIGRNLS